MSLVDPAAQLNADLSLGVACPDTMNVAIKQKA